MKFKKGDLVIITHASYRTEDLENEIGTVIDTFISTNKKLVYVVDTVNGEYRAYENEIEYAKATVIYNILKEL